MQVVAVCRVDLSVTLGRLELAVEQATVCCMPCALVLKWLLLTALVVVLC